MWEVGFKPLNDISIPAVPDIQRALEASVDEIYGGHSLMRTGTVLSVSDLLLHAVSKLPAQAQAFYSNSKEAHVMCAVTAVESLADDPERLRTRKLRRAIDEVPFR